MGISMQPQRPRYRPVRPVNTVAGDSPAGQLPAAGGAPGTIGEPPNPVGAVGAPVPGVVGGRGPRTPTGDLAGGKTTLPGSGGAPANANGFRPFTPATGVGGMGYTGRGAMPRPGAAPRPGARPQIGAPPAPPAPPALPPIEPSRVEPTPIPIGFGNEVDPTFDSDLRSQIYTPGEDPRLQGAQAGTDAAMKGLGGPGYADLAAGGEGRYRKLLGTGAVAGGPDVEAVDGGRYLEDQDAALAGLGGPSRTALAQQALKDFEAQGEKGLAQRFRKVGQNAAKFGRIGSGMVTTELGDLQSDYETNLMSKRNELARDVSEGDIGDRFRRVDATSNLRRGESGIESGLRGESRLERGYDTDIAIGNEDRAFDRNRSAFDLGGRDATQTINDRYNQFDAAGSLEDRVYGQGQGNRSEFRGERARQDQLGRQSIDDRIRQRELENAEKRERAIRANMLMQAGGRTPSLDELLG